MLDLNDLEINIGDATPTVEGGAATTEDFANVLGAVISATSDVPVTESTDPTPTPNEVTIPVPAKTEISADVYNEAIKALEKSFKEGAEILGMLQQVTITEAQELTIDELQELYTEAVVDDAIFDSYADGPYFEAARNDHKDAIRSAVKAIMAAGTTSRADKFGLKMFKLGATKKSDLEKYAIGNELVQSVNNNASGVYMSKVLAGGTVAAARAAAFISVPVAALVFAGLSIGGTLLKRKTFDRFVLNRLREDKTIKTKYWQMVGSFLAKDDAELNDAIKHYSELFADQLKQGDTELKLCSIKLRITHTTSEKNYEGSCYLLIVDTTDKCADVINIKMSEADLKKAETAVDSKADKKPEEKK